MEARLRECLDDLAREHRRARRLTTLAGCWTVAALLGLGLWLSQPTLGHGARLKLWLAPVALGASLAVVFLRRRSRNETADLFQALEPNAPAMRHLLLAAAEQRATSTSGAFSFLQMRLVETVLAHPRQSAWRQQLRRRLRLAQVGHGVALAALLATVVGLERGGSQAMPGLSGFVGEEITVTPGDVELERGTGLVVTARFSGVPPLEVTLVVRAAGGKEARLPMARRLADPVFGASVPEISEAGVYRVEFRGKRTRDFRITVFDFPALVRADASLTYPAYTGLTNHIVRDTLRVSAVQGTHLAYTLHLNKPVARARWVGKDQVLTLAAQSNALAVLPDFLLTNSLRFSLELVDAAGRSNKFASDFVLQALTNQRPEVKLLFPRGDRRVSRLEELQLQAEAADDFGLLRYGVGFGVAGQSPQFIQLGQAAPAHTKRQFDYLIPLEKLGVDVDEAVAYFAWAEDYGPDGEPRRTFSDMFFAEVRPFEEVFRPDQSGAAEGGSQGGSGEGNQGGGGNQPVRLAELQKQIVIATWNLQREKTGAGTARHP